MTENSPRRAALITVASLGALTCLYLAYQQYATANKHNETGQGLHRSNAVRRPHGRRQSQRSGDSTELVDDPYTNTYEQLRLNKAYGQYENTWMVENRDLVADLNLELKFDDLRSICMLLTSRMPNLTLAQHHSLRDHVVKTFMFRFLRTELPEGYSIVANLPVWQEALTQCFNCSEDLVASVAAQVDAGHVDFDQNWTIEEQSSDNPLAPQPPIDINMDEILEGAQHISGVIERDDDSANEQDQDQDDPGFSQNMMDLLYHIAAESAKRDGFIHRGVECNSCGACPIQGIRYHCANCYDYDLCEVCEAGQVHVRHHVFYKIRIPAPSRGHIKQVTPKWYPGNPNAFPAMLPMDVKEQMLEETGMDRTEVDALYEQFKCLAGAEYPLDPCNLGVGINRRGFDQYFIPSSSRKPGPPNLIYDRIFAFYDTNGDGIIGFQEYLKGLADLQKKTRADRLKRIFQGYDLNEDGYVERKDFLRMFRAYYALSKDINREMVNSQEEFGYIDEEIREVVQGSQPISAAFGGNVLIGHESRTGQDKTPGANGDLSIVDGPNAVLQNDLEPRGERARAIGNVAVGHGPRSHPFRSFRAEPRTDEPLMHLPLPTNFEVIGIQHADDATEAELTGPEPPLQAYGWPPLLMPEPADIINALGVEVPLDEITDPVDRSRVFYAQSRRLDEDSDRHVEMTRTQAVNDRWQRRQFYLDEEEGMSKPQGYTEPDSSDDEVWDKHVDRPSVEATSSSRRQSLRSRSSSKVRFDDSAIDTDYETRSNTSSRSIPVNERWGGFELSQPELDVGKEILYQAVQQGFNDLLDTIFKQKEDEAIEVQKTRRDRAKWHTTLMDHKRTLIAADEKKQEALRQADMQRTVELLGAEDSEKAADQAQSSVNVASHDGHSNGAQSNTQERVEGLSEGDGAAEDRTVSESSSVDENDEAQMQTLFEAKVTREVEKALNIATSRHMFEKKEELLDEESDHDPTLPQFRPDAADGTAGKKSKKFEPPRERVMDQWLKHEKVEEEAVRRGGYGRLNFWEFSRRMVPEKELNQKGERSDTSDTPAFWESTADLGKMAFIGTWLEMASF